MRRLVAGLVGKMDELEADVGALRAENQSLCDDNERLKLENDSLRLDNQLFRDEIARLKNLPPRPPFRPSGMENASKPAAGNSSKGGRGAKRDQVTREVIVKADAPEGSRFKGYETILVHRRERWVTMDGKTILVPLPDGIVGGIGSWPAAVLSDHACARSGDNGTADIDAEWYRGRDIEELVT